MEYEYSAFGREADVHNRCCGGWVWCIKVEIQSIFYWYSYKWMHVFVCPSVCSISATRCGFQQSFMFGCLQSKLTSTYTSVSFQSGIILTVQEAKKDSVNFTDNDSSYRHSWFCSDLQHLFATLFHISLEAFMAHFAQMIVIWVVTVCGIVSCVGTDVSEEVPPPCSW